MSLMRNDLSILTADALRAWFQYFPETGELWSRRTNKRVGFNTKRGNRSVSFKKGIYQEHRIIWILMTGQQCPTHIDHKDGDPTNNKWNNLRQATNAENLHNMRRPRRNTTGFKGAHRSHIKKFRARLSVGGKSVHLGYFPTPEEAHEAYMKAATEHFGEFAKAL